MEPFRFSFKELAESGKSVKDYIAPPGFDFRYPSRFKAGRMYGSVHYLDIIAPRFNDELLKKLLDIDDNLTITMHMQTMDPVKAIKMLKGALTNIQKMKIEEQKKAVRSGYDMDILPTDIITYEKDTLELLDDLNTSNQKIIKMTFLITCYGRSKRELKNITQRVSGIIQQANCNLRCLQYLQEQGLMASAPIGCNDTGIERVLTTKSTAILVPFCTQELFMPAPAIYYGLNALSNNMIMADRKRLRTPNGVILGTPGSGKSFSAKREILSCFLMTRDDVIICDPEGEYFALVGALHGQVVKLATNSKDYLNPMDIQLSHKGDKEALKLKSDFLITLCDLIAGGKDGLENDEKGIIDECIRHIYDAYLQYGTLQKLGLGHFDSWASSFGETQTAIELAPEGTGYRAKTRFAKFFNLPELIALFKESADIQTPVMLNLPVPEAEYENVVLKPSEYQKDMVASLAERAEAVRDRQVQPYEDNMLKITNDGRKLALDQRLINDMLPDDENSKASTCVEKAFEIWEQTKEQKSTQLIFCDLSTPKGDGTFNVYEDIRNKLIEKGVPPEEIVFIHEANTELRKAELFGKVRSGQVRFLLGSTQKMGAGTNVQDRLIALHHLDVPWRPSDIEQQEGRILRQGNLNPKVKIFRYVTEGTFDSYSWQLIENKQKFIGQIMTSKSPVRSCEDVDEAALTYAEVKALATGNPYIKEKMDLDIQVSKLKLMKANHTSQKYRLEDNIAKHYPQQITILKERISGMQADIQTAKANLPVDKEQFSMKVGDKLYTDKKEAGTALVEMCKEIKTVNAPAVIGEYAGFKMAVSFDAFNHKFVMNLKGQLSHNLEVGSDPIGNIARINHALESMPKQLMEAQTKLETVEHQLETAKVEVTKPFAQEAELAEKLERLSALNALLNMDEKGNDGIDMDDEPEAPKSEKEVADRPAKNIPIAEKAVGTEQDKGIRQYADAPAERVSLKAKLEVMKAKVAGEDTEKPMPQKVKGKEETL